MKWTVPKTIKQNPKQAYPVTRLVHSLESERQFYIETYGERRGQRLFELKQKEQRNSSETA